MAEIERTFGSMTGSVVFWQVMTSGPNKGCFIVLGLTVLDAFKVAAARWIRCDDASKMTARNRNWRKPYESGSGLDEKNGGITDPRAQKLSTLRFCENFRRLLATCRRQKRCRLPPLMTPQTASFHLHGTPGLREPGIHRQSRRRP